MRIDAHQHYWNYMPEHYQWIGDAEKILKTDFLPQDLKPVLDGRNMDGSIAVQARQSEDDTRFLAWLAAEHPSIRAVVGWTDLRSPELGGRLEYWSAYPMVRGFRHMIQDEKDPAGFLEDHAFNRGVEKLQSRELVYEVLVHEPDLAAAADFCRRHERAPLVLDHLGKPDVREGDIKNWVRQLGKLAELPHVCCKLSGLVTEAAWHGWSEAQLVPYIESALWLFGAERLMFGSDWPVCLLSATPDEVYSLMEKATGHLSETEQAAIWGGTASKIYKI